MAQSSDPTPQGFSIGTRLKSFVYAGRGIRALIADEHNAWLHLAASLTVVGLGAFLRISIADWRWLIAAMGMVWLAEALNTAIEELCDHVTPDRHPAIGRIKEHPERCLLRRLRQA